MAPTQASDYPSKAVLMDVHNTIVTLINNSGGHHFQSL